MRSADRFVARGRRAGLAGILLAAWSVHALAGGPLYVVPSGGKLVPARWEGTVNVYTDQGSLGALPNATANQLVANSLQQWSSVATSSFRAEIAGTLPFDVTGANAGTVIGTRNGEGIHVIYDSDGSVIADFMGAGYGVLGIASPEYLAAEGSTRIVEGWVIITGEEDYTPWWPDYTPGDPTAGVVTHEFGHAINLAHSQTNGYYSRNRGNPDLGLPEGPEQAGPDQCGKVVAAYPDKEHIETMYPLINPLPWTSGFNSPQMATVNVADDRASLSALYPAAHYAATTGTLKGRVVAKDGASELTGINVIARRVDSPFDAISRISGDLTQGRLGPDGNFTMTGLTPGASYVVYIDQIADGGFSTPKAILLGPEEYWNAAESGDATSDDACAATPITLEAGEVRSITIAMNGIARAPTFTHIPYGLVSGLSDNGQKVVGVYGTFRSPYWVWDKTSGSNVIGGAGFLGAISGNGRVVGGSIGVPVDTPYGPVLQEHAALWTKEGGWKSIADRKLEGCDMFHTDVYDLSTDGSAAVGLAFVDCANAYAFKWTAKTGMKLLPKTSENQQCEDPWSGGTYACEGSARANAVSGSGNVVVGWEEIPEAYGFRVGSIWQGEKQTLLRDPGGDNAVGGWVGEVTAVNTAGTTAVGGNAGPALDHAYLWTAAKGVTNLGRYPGQVCYFDWWTWQDVCEDRETVAYSVSDDGKVITGASRLLGAGVDDAALYTPKMGWMLLGDFLQRQGVLEAARWHVLGAYVSADGKTLAGTAVPLAADYYHGFRLDLDQVFVCSGSGAGAKTLRVGFPDAMDQHLARGDSVGICPGQGPL
jgi:uncharacterized membrane protein